MGEQHMAAGGSVASFYTEPRFATWHYNLYIVETVSLVSSFLREVNKLYYNLISIEGGTEHIALSYLYSQYVAFTLHALCK